ncbi:leucine-rich repeat-containing protein 42-like isoform X2 [Ostrea edulis]|uniref:leucine-rich repeat-containing protein 42-like isoform X2 n=1 Tax=Ostrea edulis TaxID=37623 RepID=UPI0024AF8D77|nr:leucine-rich repeat-containing protein 42-like isoform X2 [Ostrea edulis]
MERPPKAAKTEKFTQQEEKVLESLYKLCIQYIATNLHMVESFRGFPELVAADIFKEADKLSKFDILTQPHRNMKLFCEIYPNNVLSSLNISSCYVGLNYSVECFETFSGLHSLDVSSCFLGDHHEFLSHIAHLKCLINLNLRKNSLSDKGVRSLYAPFTLFKRGPEHLKVLDISENGCISEKSVKKLKCFKNLQKIDITGTSVKVKEMGSEWRLCPEKTDSLMSITNEGWASEAVQKWEITPSSSLEG